MAALGLVWGEVGISTTKYSDVRDIVFPAPVARMVFHDVPNSTYIPSKGIGYEQISVSFTVKVDASSLNSFISDVLTSSSERKISFYTNEEDYIYAKGGIVNSIEPIQKYSTSATRYWWVSVTFPASRTILYNATGDATLWGG